MAALSSGLVSIRFSKEAQGMSRFVYLKQWVEHLPTCFCPVLVEAFSEMVNSETFLVCICMQANSYNVGDGCGAESWAWAWAWSSLSLCWQHKRKSVLPWNCPLGLSLKWEVGWEDMTHRWVEQLTWARRPQPRPCALEGSSLVFPWLHSFLPGACTLSSRPHSG